MAYLFLFYDLFRDQVFLRRTFYVFLAAGILAAGIAIVQYLIIQYNVLSFLEQYVLPGVQRGMLQFGQEDLTEGYRSAGTFFHPNSLGIYLSFLFPFVMLFFCFTGDKIKKFCLGACCLIFFAALFCAGGRGAFLNVFVSGLFLVWAFWRKVSKLAIFIVVVCVLVGAWACSDQISAHFRLNQGLAGRDLIWEHAWQAFEQHPWLGIGPGVFPGDYIAQNSFSSPEDLAYVLNELSYTGSVGVLTAYTAHNLFFNCAAEMGFVAVVLIVMIYFIYFKEFIQYARSVKQRESFMGLLAVAATAAIIGNFAQAFFEASVNFIYLPMGLSFAWAMSAGFAAMRAEKAAVD
jgi:O-antigen ligase